MGLNIKIELRVVFTARRGMALESGRRDKGLDRSKVGGLPGLFYTRTFSWRPSKTPLFIFIFLG